ncbi:Nucleosome assembly protein (NAP) [Ceratobasidium sp. AG-Ba]|nr:Nucleosome assembly protein (NAP) [Ceratobasidium sp. AG-Ba]
MVAAKRAANSDEPKPESPLAIRELEPAEERLLKELERAHTRAQIAADLARLRILQPLYESRRKVLSEQKNFWGIALSQHHEIGEYLDHPDDAQAMSYLRDIWVERDPKEYRAFTLEFHFDENPYFSDSVLKKSYSYTLPPETTVKSTTPDENGVTDIMVDFNFERDIVISGAPINWKDESKALTKLRPRPGMDEIEKQIQENDDDDDDPTIDYGSFFHFFEEKEDDFDFGQSIAEEVFADPIAFFTGEHPEARSNEAWEDEEDDD